MSNNDKINNEENLEENVNEKEKGFKKLRPNKKVKSEADKDQERLDRAKKLAARKIALKGAYDSVETSVARIGHWFSSTVDKFLFSRKYDKIIAIALACILYMAMNFSRTGVFVLDSTYTIKDHPVTLVADSAVYEIIGYDKTVDVILTGSSTEVNVARNQQNTVIKLDLTGYQTGEHTIKFSPANFSNRVSVSTKPESTTVTIRKKETERFKITHEYLNINKMDEKYYPEEPEFETNEVLVKASRKTLNEIAFIKALIDVEGVTESFETEAPLYAYDKEGKRMEVDILPKIAKVKVPVSSPSKTVKLTVIPEGIVPNNMSIESIALDHNSVKLYGNPETLEKIEEISVKIDASKLDRDMKVFEYLVLPSGIRYANVSQLAMEVKLVETSSKVLKNIPVSFENNLEGYRTRLKDSDQADVDIEIFGAERVLEDITEDNFGRVYFDMAGVKPGEVTLELKVDSNHFLIKYELEFDEITMEVVSE